MVRSSAVFLVGGLLGVLIGHFAWRDSPARSASPVLPTQRAERRVVAIASGVHEFAAQGIERAPIFLPRVSHAVFSIGAVASGGGLDETTITMGFPEILARGFSLYDDNVRDTLPVGFSVGSGLPMLVAIRSRLRFGLPFRLAQVVLVVAWYLFVGQ